jgi:hypothetical protein
MQPDNQIIEAVEKESKVEEKNIITAEDIHTKRGRKGDINAVQETTVTQFAPL